MKTIRKIVLYVLIFLITILTVLQIFGYNMPSIIAGILQQNHSVETKNPLNIEDASVAYFSAGCFWCAESSFEKYPGVIDAVSGYAGGTEMNPTYSQVSRGTTGHRESVKIIYDKSKISYNDLLQIFWRTANPTDPYGQYVDRGFQYTSAIFYSNLDEKEKAETSKTELSQSGRFEAEIITPIVPFTTFYPAEEYHQNYYKLNSIKYNIYTNGSGRKQFLEKTWGDDLDYEISTQEDLKTKLTPLQYRVTQEGATEQAFNNEYWDNKESGIYVDIIDGTPLYSSLDKYDSGTGWPSFTKPIKLENITEHEDNTFFSKRTEIRSSSSNSHLGHVFNDGPTDTGGLRYCMNSAAMRFIPVDKLQEEGYEKYLELFQ